MAAVGNAHPRSLPAGACAAKAAAEITTKSIPIQFFMGASTRRLILGESSNFSVSFCYLLPLDACYIARQEEQSRCGLDVRFSELRVEPRLRHDRWELRK